MKKKRRKKTSIKKKEKKAFYRRKPFLIISVVVLFILALYLRGEHFSGYAFVARLLDALGEGYADMTINDG